MKCALYARNLTPAPTGRGAVAREIIERLCADPTLECEVFSGAAIGIEGRRHRAATGSNLLSDAYRSLWGIGREIRALGVDAVWSATHLLPGHLPASTRTVVTLLDVVWRDHPETMRPVNRWVAAQGERSLMKADRILCISDFTRSRLVYHWPHLESRAHVLRLAPNPRLATAAPVDLAARVPAHGHWVVNVDTVEPRKDLGTLFEAMAACPDISLIQCGAMGWHMDAQVTRAVSLNQVQRWGYVDEGTLASLYRGALCAVFPSLYEGFHLPPLDAASVGCPVLLSDIPAHREVFADAALYFRAGDVQDLVRSLRTLAASPDMRAKFAGLARERAQSFSWDAAARDVTHALREVAG